MLSKITLFKKKIEIDDEQNRLGPNNKINKKEHGQLYFSTNQSQLSIFKRRDYGTVDSKSDSSSSSSNHSMRSKIA